MAKKQTNVKVVEKTVVYQTNRQNIDIQDWRNAIKTAEQKDYPRRHKLYDIYSDVLMDASISTVIEKRKTAILNAKIEFVRDGKPVDDINVQLNSPWFTNFINDLLDTRFWGFSLFQFYRDGDWLNYDLIPRKHVDPKKKLLLTRQDALTGEDYTQFPNMLECGDPDDLGLLCKLAQYAIYIRNCMGDYAQYSELFGQPIREGTYDGYDEEARTKLVNDLTDMGGSAVIVHPDGTKVNLLTATQNGSSATLYKTLIDICKANISTLVLGNTLTTDAGEKGSRSLGEVHKEAEEDKKQADRIYVLNTLNYFLTDIFINLGLNVAGGEFCFVENKNVDLTARIAIDKEIKNLGVPISDDYFYETYGIPKPDNYDELKKLKPIQASAILNNHFNDFQFSPHKKNHLNVAKKSPLERVTDFFE